MQMENEYMKICSTLYIIRDCKLKEESDTTIHLLPWPIFRTVTTQNAIEGVEQQELVKM